MHFVERLCETLSRSFIFGLVPILLFLIPHPILVVGKRGKDLHLLTFGYVLVLMNLRVQHILHYHERTLLLLQRFVQRAWKKSSNCPSPHLLHSMTRPWINNRGHCLGFTVATQHSGKIFHMFVFNDGCNRVSSAARPDRTLLSWLILTALISSYWSRRVSVYIVYT